MEKYVNKLISFFSSKYLFIIVFIINNILFSICLVTIGRTSPASGYEQSIYLAYPYYFWMFMLLNLMLSILLIFVTALLKIKKNYWFYSLLIILVTYFIIFMLPYFRGYIFFGRGGGDIFFHIGWAKTIINTGNLSNYDLYPVIHIIMVIFSYLGLSLNIGATFLPAIFAILNIIFIFLLSRIISDNREQSLFILIFATPLLLSVYSSNIYPAVFSVYMIPLILFIIFQRYLKDQKLSYALLLIILAILIVFFHPISTVILIIILITLALLDVLLKKQKNYVSVSLFLIILVPFTLWILSFENTKKVIHQIYYWLFYDLQVNPADLQFDILNKAQLSLIQIINISFRSYGQVFIYLITAAIFTCIVLFYLKKYKNNKNNYIILFAILFIISIIFSFIELFKLRLESEPIRILRLSILMAIILNGLVYYRLIVNTKNIKKVAISIGLIISVYLCVYIGVFSLFNSPWIYDDNKQFSHMESAGMQWYFFNANLGSILYANELNTDKYYCYFFGFQDISLNSAKLIPSHFGYDSNNRFLKTKCYMIIGSYMLNTYKVYPIYEWNKVSQYLPNDIYKLENDNSVDKIYENNELEVWKGGV